MTNNQNLPKDIILIHGLYQNSLVMKVLGRHLLKFNYNVHYFDYSTLRAPLSTNIEKLSKYLQQFRRPFAIIGHSLGCVLTLHALKKESFPQLKSVIAITPPFHGSRIVEYLTKHHSGFLVGKAEDTLRPNKNIAISWDSLVPLGVIAGTQNIGPTALVLESFTNTIMKDSLIGDGTVYLDEANILGLTDITTLPKSHTMILFDSRLPILCDQFIKHHRFDS